MGNVRDWIELAAKFIEGRWPWRKTAEAPSSTTR